MKILNGAYPPNIDKIRKYLPIADKGILFCWGDKIFNPKGLKLDPAIIKHELVHFNQQMHYGTNTFWQNFTLPKHRIGKWWDRYLEDYAFRLAQEVPAYQVQYQEYLKVIKDPNERHSLALKLARDLSSPIYGNLISTNQALQAIKNEKIYEFKVA